MRLLTGLAFSVFSLVILMMLKALLIYAFDFELKDITIGFFTGIVYYESLVWYDNRKAKNQTK